MVREWRHVRLLKRMGRGHSASGVKGTRDGECAVLCPACPIPGANLPSDWKEKPMAEQYVFPFLLNDFVKTWIDGSILFTLELMPISA
jgi:hypothetical protein